MGVILSDSNRKMYVKIFLALVLSISITMIVLSTVLFVKFNQTLSDEIYLANMESLVQVSKEVNNMSNIAATISDQIYRDLSISKLLYYSKPEVYDLSLAMRQLNNYRVSIPFIDSIYVYNSITNEFYTQPGNIMTVQSDTKNSNIKREDFFDIQILWMMDEFKKYRPYIPIPRKFVYKNDINVTKNLYTFMVYERAPGNKLNSAIFINISDEWISSIINSDSETKRMNTFIIDRDGVVVSESAAYAMMSNHSREGYIKDILTKDSAGYLVDNVNGIKSLVVYTGPDSFGWRYIRVIQWDAIFYKVDQTRTITIVICFSIFLIGIFISVIISGRLYNPMKKILSNIERLEHERSKDEKLLKQEILRNIILGRETVNKSNKEKIFKELELGLGYMDKIYVILIKIDNYSTFTRVHDQEEQNLFKFAVINIASEILSEPYKVEAVDIGKDSVVIILGSPNLLNKDMKENFSVRFKKIQSAVGEYFRLSLTFALSTVGEGVRNNIHSLYNQALEASLYRLFFGRGSIIYSADVQEYNQKEYAYPVQKEKQMVEALMSGKTDEAKKIYSEIVEDVTTYPYAICERTISHLIFTLNDAVNTIKSNNSLPLPMKSGVSVTIISESEVIEEINDKVFNLLDDIKECLEERKNSKYSNIITGINDYIQTEYSNPLLSVDSIAEAFGVSTAHACRVYKQHTMHTILDEIVDTRMKKARELLLSTEFPVSEIAEKVGFSSSSYFFKAFKTANGVTPSEYRKNMNTNVRNFDSENQ